MVQKVDAYMFDPYCCFQLVFQYFGGFAGKEILYRGQVHQYYYKYYKPCKYEDCISQYLEKTVQLTVFKYLTKIASFGHIL